MMKPEGITDRPVPPWELPGAFRRDCLPHRGSLLIALANMSGVAAAISIFVVTWPVAGPIALTLAVAVRRMARRDLAQMRVGLVGPGGEAETRRAQHDALVGIVIALIGLAGACFLLGPSLVLELLGIRR